MNDSLKSRSSGPPQNAVRAVENDHSSAPEHKPISPRKALVGVALLVIVAVVLAVAGILPRQSADAALRQHTDETAAPYVIALVTPSLGLRFAMASFIASGALLIIVISVFNTSRWMPADAASPEIRSDRDDADEGTSFVVGDVAR